MKLDFYKIIDDTKIYDLDYDTITIGTSLTLVFLNFDPIIIRIIKNNKSLAHNTFEYRDNEDLIIMAVKLNG